MGSIPDLSKPFAHRRLLDPPAERAKVISLACRVISRPAYPFRPRTQTQPPSS